MTLRIPSLATVPLLLAAGAVLAAPPLAIPIPRPTPEQVARLAAEAEEESIREEAEEAASEPEAAPEAPAVPEAAPAPEAPVVPEAAPAPKAPAPAPVVAPAPAPAVVPAPAITPARVPVPAAAKSPSVVSTNDVFRRDPFWPVAVARARKAEHDARVAARIEAERRAAALAKAREAAIARGEDPDQIDEDEAFDLARPASGPAAPGMRISEAFDGASGEEWDAAFAKLPPRSGYFGGKKPALMLKGDRTPHYVGDRLCVTNRGVVFTWCVSSVDFRAYTHELKRISARPVPPDKNKKP